MKRFIAVVATLIFVTGLTPLIAEESAVPAVTTQMPAETPVQTEIKDQDKAGISAEKQNKKVRKEKLKMIATLRTAHR